MPSACTLDERVDVWSLGCLLFFMLHAASPFELAANQGGGSLMLAVLNGRVAWPEGRQEQRQQQQHHQPRAPQPVRELVEACLTTDPTARPHVGEVQARALRLLAGLD